jgi:nucleoside-diphosphate-sugar epimerase
MRIKDARQTFLGIWIRNLIEKKPIQVFGDGKQRRDYNYVDDVVDALIIAATRNESAGKIYNLGAPRPISLQETAQIMCEKIEGASYALVPFPEERKVIDVGDFISDYSIFQSSFGWNPKVDFETGIERSIEFFKDELKYYI